MRREPHRADKAFFLFTNVILQRFHMTAYGMLALLLMQHKNIDILAAYTLDGFFKAFLRRTGVVSV
ncbi:hypothetical protein SDC9_173770 [bioreactor metagenome]|uniref:Uncharacterized protein n=1 Tax=bioreactor metagenome TaxID=1076179 RepID=A0A645GJC9_9ZZZZ